MNHCNIPVRWKRAFNKVVLTLTLLSFVSREKWCWWGVGRLLCLRLCIVARGEDALMMMMVDPVTPHAGLMARAENVWGPIITQTMSHVIRYLLRPQRDRTQRVTALFIRKALPGQACCLLLCAHVLILMLPL